MPVAFSFWEKEGGELGFGLVYPVFLCILSLSHTHIHIWLIAFSFLLLLFSHAGGEEVLN